MELVGFALRRYITIGCGPPEKVDITLSVSEPTRITMRQSCKLDSSQPLVCILDVHRPAGWAWRCIHLGTYYSIL